MSFRFNQGDRPVEGYTIQRGVGRGGFGEVYYAVSDGGKEVALKYLRDNPGVELRGEDRYGGGSSRLSQLFTKNAIPMITRNPPTPMPASAAPPATPIKNMSPNPMPISVTPALRYRPEGRCWCRRPR